MPTRKEIAHVAGCDWVVGPTCLADFEVIMFAASTCKIFRIDGAYFTTEGGGILHINEM